MVKLATVHSRIRQTHAQVKTLSKDEAAKQTTASKAKPKETRTGKYSSITSKKKKNHKQNQNI